MGKTFRRNKDNWDVKDSRKWHKEVRKNRDKRKVKENDYQE